ncbi:MAG: putative selenate ABC transporter substrate-binding protein [Micromonosporaceae bacterium]
MARNPTRMALLGVLVAVTTVVALIFVLEDSRSRSGAVGGTLHVGAIPDQDPHVLQRQYEAVTRYLAEKLDVKVRYIPVTDYTASVTAFRRGDLDLVFFGGLTGVQARNQVPGAIPVAQRDIDAKFKSVFVANPASGIAPVGEVAGLTALRNHSFTLGSESSTSGRLMPQFFLDKAGVKLDDFRGQVGFSGAHDTTVKLVAAGTYDVGALNAAVWDELRSAGKVDSAKVREVFRTPPYHDYHWLLRPDADKRFGAGFTDRVRATLLGIDGSDGPERKILQLFQAGEFIATKPENYLQIEKVARDSGLIS